MKPTVSWEGGLEFYISQNVEGGRGPSVDFYAAHKSRPPSRRRTRIGSDRTDTAISAFGITEEREGRSLGRGDVYRATGCCTGNGEKLSSSQTDPVQAIKSAAA